MSKLRVVIIIFLIVALIIPITVAFSVTEGIKYNSAISTKSSKYNFSETKAVELYQSYLKDMNEYGLDDPEKISNKYFTKRLKETVDMTSIKKDFFETKTTKPVFKGEVIGVEKSTKGYYVDIKEWIEYQEEFDFPIDTNIEGTYEMVYEDGNLKIDGILISSGVEIDLGIDDEETHELEREIENELSENLKKQGIN